MKAPIKPQVIWMKFMVEALDDWRIESLAQKLGVDYANALLMLLRVWKHLYNSGGKHLPPEQIDSAARRVGMAEAMILCELAEAKVDGCRVKGNEHAMSYAKSKETRSERAKERHERERKAKVQAGAQSTSAVTTPATQGLLQGLVQPNSSSRSYPDSAYPDSGSALSTVIALSPEVAAPLGDKASSEPVKAAARSKAPKPPKKPPDAMAATLREVGDYWTNLWASAQGEQTYHWTKAEFLSLEPLVRKHGPGEVKTRMFALIKSPPDGVKRLLGGSPPTVALFVKCFNSLAAWSSEKAAAAKAEPQDDLHRDDGWKRKAELRYTELNVLANRKMPAWWCEPERIAMKQGVNGEPAIPLVAAWTPKDPSYLLRRLCDYVKQTNELRAAGDRRDAVVVEEWYRKRFNFGGEK